MGIFQMNLDTAYANAEFIPGASDYPPRWEADALAFRQKMTDEGRAELDIAFGEHQRERLDLFWPASNPTGLVVFIHGGYWRRFGKSDWSHFAAGSLEAGWTVGIPGYPLCPEVSVSQITKSICAAVSELASRVSGPIRLTGHSAGGHLVARLPAMPLSEGTLERIEKIVPISPVSDLRPLLQTSINDDLKLNEEEAKLESPVLQTAPACPVSVWVGADERPAFLDQAQWLADAWDAECHVAPGQHHFDVIDGLRDPDSPLLAQLLG